MKKTEGFTLIELMVVVAIVGILAAVAYPSYVEHVNKGRRAEARAALLQAVQQLERYYSTNGTYLDSAELAAVYDTVVPAGGSVSYNIAVTGTPTRSTYVLRATRAGTMASDGCGNFEINHAGVRALNGNSKSIAECW